MNDKKPSPKTLSGKKKIYFRLLSVFFSIILLVILELLLRLFSVGDNLSLFINHPDPNYSEYKMVNPIVGKKYFQKFEYTQPANDIFLKKKPENSVRIFVMGSSTVFGFPYGRNVMFSRILNKMLEDTYPNKKIEVVNTAITAINSYTFADYIDEILDNKPDAILFYEGHNEFYGAFGIGSNETMSRNKFIIKLHLKLMDLRLYQVMRKAIHGIASKLSSGSGKENHGTLMKRIVKDKDIVYQSDDYKTAMKYFADNMTTIIEKAKKKNVPVFISELVSNVKDLEPFNSIKTDKYEAAIDVYHQAQKALADSNIKLADELFTKAKDLDCIRFRASEEVNDIIRDLAKKENIVLVPMINYFKENSEYGIIGGKLLTEHVHPNVLGYFIMANAFYNSLTTSNLFSGEQKSNNVEPLQYYINNYGYTQLDVLSGYHKIELLKHYWPFVNDFSNANDYKMFYHPKGFIDSLAFMTIKYENVDLGEIHLKLAKQFVANNDIYNAYREYETILRMNPYIAVNYRDAANCLLQLSELPLALKYYEKSLQYENSYVALFKAGEIYLIKGDYKSALNRFDQAFRIAPQDKKINVLKKLFAASVYGGFNDRAAQLDQQIKSFTGGTGIGLPPKRYYYLDYVPSMTASVVNEAKTLMSKGESDKALGLLTNSLLTWDSHIANRLIGEIYIQKKDYKNAVYYFDKIYSEFCFDPFFLHNYIILKLTQNDKASANRLLAELKMVAPAYPEIKQIESMINSQK